MTESWAPTGPGAAQATTDVVYWRTYFAPYDDVHGALIAELLAAIARYGAGVECHSSQYSFTDADIEALFEQLAQNPASRFLFDRSCVEQDRSDGELVRKLQAVAPSQVAIGTSPVGGQILHTKAFALLCPDGSGFTFSGSFNLTFDATEEFNDVDLVWSRSRAELFAQQIDAMFQAVQQQQTTPQADELEHPEE